MDFLQCVTGGDTVGKISKEGRAPLSLLASSPCWEMQEAEESRLQCSVAVHCIALQCIAVLHCVHCGAAVGAVGTVECPLHCTVHSAHSSVTVDPRWQPAGSDLAPHCTSCKLLPGVAWDFTQYCLVLPCIADSIETVLTH